MKLLQYFRMIPAPTSRFGMVRTLVLWLVLASIYFLLYKAFGDAASTNSTPMLLGGIALALFGVATPFFWNRRARRSAPEGFADSPRNPFFILIAIPTAVVLVWAIENWRGAMAWKSIQDSMRARGEPLHVRELLEPVVPPELNFAESPLMAGLLRYVKTNDSKGEITFKWVGSARMRELSDSLRLPEIPQPSAKTKTKPLQKPGYDLAALAAVLRQETNAYKTWVEDPATGTPKEVTLPFDLPHPPADVSDAKAVLIALEGRKAVMEKIQEASKRPHCRYSIRYEDGANALLPHLSMHKQMAKLFQIRSAARIETGDIAGAEDDVKTIFRLGFLSREEPTLIGYLVRVSVESMGCSAFWQGATKHAWTEQQLVGFQALFEEMHQKEAILYALRGERLFATTTYELLIQDPAKFATVFEGAEQEFPAEFVQWIPKGWIRQNQAFHAETMDTLITGLRSADNTRCISSLPPWTVLESGNLKAKRGFRPYRMLSDLTLPSLNKFPQRGDRLLASTRLAGAVCALERYRIANGTYPKTLPELTPRFATALPTDPVNGAPLRYQLESDGTFTLYSIGLNQKDDGGFSDEQSTNGGEPLDWVWPGAEPTTGRRLF